MAAITDPRGTSGSNNPSTSLYEKAKGWLSPRAAVTGACAARSQQQGLEAISGDQQRLPARHGAEKYPGYLQVGDAGLICETNGVRQLHQPAPHIGVDESVLKRSQ